MVDIAEIVDGGPRFEVPERDRIRRWCDALAVYDHDNRSSLQGRKDFEDLIASPDGIVLAARSSDDIVGLLACYAAKSSPTRVEVCSRSRFAPSVVDQGRVGVVGAVVTRFGS
ncbi:MAG: hypothetical protein M3Q82_07980 [Actinomycetota bacterium]|nr:hypothetical protein [Actinomycetota bacterium]